MNKYVVTIHFQWNKQTMELIPEHRAYINTLIEDQVLEHYAVSMENQSLWITLNAKNKGEVKKLLSRSPFYKYWTYEINELIIWDGQSYRLPVVQLN